MEFVLKPEDERLGAFNEDGSIKTYPVYTLHGAKVEWVHATVKRVGVAYFVIVGPGQDSPDLVISVEAPRAPRMAAKKGDE